MVKTKAPLSLKTKLGLVAVQLLVSALALGGAQASPLQCTALFAEKGEPIRALLEPKVFSIFEKFEDGAQDFTKADAFAREINAKDERTRAQWLRAVGKAYRLVPKKQIIPNRSNSIGGRRLLDRLIMLTLRYDLSFEADQKISSPRAAFEKTIAQQNSIFGTTATARDIDSIVQTIARELPARQKAMNGYPLVVIVGGSFANGKANLTESDIDISINNPDMIKAGVLEQWQTLINSQLRKLNADANLVIESHSASTTGAAFYGGLNPFVFEIRADRIRLHVFAPGRPMGRLFTSPEPAVYEWPLDQLP